MPEISCHFWYKIMTNRFIEINKTIVKQKQEFVCLLVCLSVFCLFEGWIAQLPHESNLYLRTQVHWMVWAHFPRIENFYFISKILRHQSHSYRGSSYAPTPSICSILIPPIDLHIIFLSTLNVIFTAFIVFFNL